MAVKLTYTTPQGAPLSTEVRVRLFEMHVAPWLIRAVFVDQTGKLIEPPNYDGATAQALITALNKADLSGAGNDMESRIIKQYKLDGKLAAGTLSGVPD